ncbi:alpha/beta hydrolase [Microbacterium aoyamense]|uniref:Alpha/beta hydrolase n=1 Tax=Microbacterium aoyamense TaxID=344166 RepID=A0ABN2PCM2_9MICO|nr:alpha/beta hydrolase fold domain-containing protein [Microbacterium aoyamense]
MTRVPYDPALVPIAEYALPLYGTMREVDDLASTRDGIAARAAALDLDALARDHGVDIEHRGIPGSGGELLTIIRPRSGASGAAAIVYVHGGGLVMGHRLQNAEELASIATRFGAPVVTVDYRLAPAHPYPAAIDDVANAWALVRDDLGFDPVLIGRSAGAGLAAALAIRLRDAGEPGPRALALWAPMLDDRSDTESCHAYEDTGLWDAVSNRTAWAAYLADARDVVPVDAAPGRATDLSALGPVYIDVGTSEIFRDEAVAFAQSLWRAGVAADLHVWSGVFHGFDAGPATAVSDRVHATRDAWIARVLADPEPA